jgi:hypothetical protein
MHAVIIMQEGFVQDDKVDWTPALRLHLQVRSGGAAEKDGAPLGDFVRKLRAAWRIFFPSEPASVSPKEAGKNRLRMILVADRCAQSVCTCQLC